MQIRSHIFDSWHRYYAKLASSLNLTLELFASSDSNQVLCCLNQSLHYRMFIFYCVAINYHKGRRKSQWSGIEDYQVETGKQFI